MSRALQVSFFVFIVLSFTVVVHWFFWRRLVVSTELKEPWRQVATWSLVALAASMALAPFVTRAVPFAISRWLVWMPYVWMGAMAFLLITLAVPSLVGLACASAQRLSSELCDFEPGRRLFLVRVVTLGATLAAVGLSAASVGAAMRPVTVKVVEVRLAHLPKEQDGFVIAQLSDLHIGLTLGKEWLQDAVSLTMDLRPDLIAITGDSIDGVPASLRREVAPLGALKAPHGVFFVTGNHEYYSGVEAWLPELAALGVRVLRNERVSIGQGDASFDLLGVDDFNAAGMAQGHGANLPKALAGANPKRETVLLAHQPRAVNEASRRDIGLVLSGHTHGGQIWPWNHFVPLQQPYVEGLHRHGARTQIYVSEGTGYWGPPMRLGTQGEITRIVLRSGK